MKKAAISLGIALSTLLLTAGGNLAPALPAVAPVKAPCTAGKIYLDKKTGLMWQDAPYTDAEDGAFAKNRSFGKAGSMPYAVRYCQNLNYAGYNDWRLPTADELMAVHHYFGENFTYSRDRDFWTSTPAVDGRYYVVYPADAYRYKRNGRESNYIRCVRCAEKQ